MKNIFLLFLLFPLFSFSKNYMGFGGGNYVFVENENLYFNLNKDTFDHRSWTYDGQNFKTEFNIELDIKTEYSSSEWFEVVLKNQNDGFMYAKYIKEPYSLKNRGSYQYTFAPLLKGGVMLGGAISRSAALARFKPFVKMAGVTVGTMLFCDQILEIGSHCDGPDAFQKVYRYVYIDRLVNPTNQSVATQIPMYFTEEENASGAARVAAVRSRIKMTDDYGRTLEQCESASYGVVCYYRGGANNTRTGYTFSFTKLTTGEYVVKVDLSDEDFESAFDAAARADASNMINAPTNGKNIGDVSLSTAAINRPVSVLSPPYTHPVSGNAQQDKLIIDTGSSGIGVNSATNTAWEYTPTLGQSAVSNAVTVETVARPDLNNDRVAAPVGTVVNKTGVVNPPTTGNPPTTTTPDITVEFPEFTDIAEFCKANPDAGACLNLKADESQSVPLVVPVEEIGLDFNVTSFFSSDGICPAPAVASISMFGVNRNLSLTFEPTCQFAEMFRYIVLILAWFLAFKIVMGRE